MESPDKKTPWKSRVNNWVESCQKELQRTTEIGKKMMNATRTNTHLNDTFQTLGQLVCRDIKSGKLDWDNPRAHELLEKIEACQNDLAVLDEEVSKIRFDDSGPKS